MTRRCSHCSNNGHNSRTCPTRTSASSTCGSSSSSAAACGSAAAVKIFGVRLTDGSIIKKSASMGNLSVLHHSSSSSAAASPNPGSPCSDAQRDGGRVPEGYLTDDPAHGSGSGNRRGERKKGVPWTEEEHRLFLIGLQMLGKGDWRGIARNYVTSRTPTQVASHAQKYFIRQSNANRRKRRSSLFDMSADMATNTPSVPEESALAPPLTREADNMALAPSLDLSLGSEYKPSEMSPEEMIKDSNENVPEPIGYTPIVPEYYHPVTFPLWPANMAPAEDHKASEMPHHQVLKPIPLLPKEQPVNVDELVGISQLCLGEADNLKEPPPLSLKLLGEPSRQSAFHANASVSASEGKHNPIQAV